MHYVTRAGEEVFRWVLQTTWQATALAGLILVAQWILRKRLSAAWRHGLWLLLVARLMMPATPQSALSVFNLFQSKPEPPLASRLYANTQSNPYNDVNVFNGTPSSNVHAEPIETLPLPAPSSVIVKPTLKIDWFDVALCGWLAGVFFFGARLIWANARFRSRISGCQPVADESVMRVFNECRAALNITQAVRVIESEEVETPAVYGLWRKWLLLPDGVFERFGEGDLRCIFLHELAHIKRGDLGVNWLVSVLQVAHWFNPALRLAFAQMRADREMAADALALAHVEKSENVAYGETILKIVENLTRDAAQPGLVGIAESKAGLAQRVRAIAQFSATRHWKWAAVVAAIVVAGVGLTDAQNGPAAAEKSQEVKEQTSIRPVVTNGPAMSVTVLDAQTGQPVPDAEVLAPNYKPFFGREQNSPHWTTDKQGIAIIHLGEPGTGHLQQMTWFPVSIRHDGYAPRGFSWSSNNADARPSMPGELTVRLERGITVGGEVRDDEGASIAGVQIMAFGSLYWAGFRKEYSEYWTDSAATTDAEGRWALKDFPSNLEYISLKVSWPDGSYQQFTTVPVTEGLNTFRIQNPGDYFSLADLRDGKLSLTLKGGVTVRGVVLDPAGGPLPGVLVKGGFGLNNLARLRETRTDAAGRFEFAHLLHRQLAVTACPVDYATTSIIIDASSNNTPVQLRVAPLNPLRMHVEDAEGRPLAGTEVTADPYRTEGQLLDFSEKTDRDGNVVWTNAPVSAFALRAKSAVDGVEQKIRVYPRQREINFQLRSDLNEEVIVTARAHDAETGVAVPLESLRFATAFPTARGFTGESEKSGSARRLAIPATSFVPGGSYPEFELEARAKNYATTYSDWRDFDEGDWTLDFALEPSHRLAQVVTLPDGSPASRTTVWSHFRTPLRLFLSSPGGIIGKGLASTGTGIDGSYELPGEADDATLIFTHDDGFLQTTVGELRRHPHVQLRPYGRVEGVLKIGGQPREGVGVNIASWNSSYQPFTLIYTDTTGANGRFGFSDIPAGDYKLYRYRYGRSGPITEDHQMPITVKAGETLKVDYSNKGRQVIGHAVPDDPGLAVDWLNDAHTLTPSVSKQAAVRPITVSDYVTEKDWRNAQDAVRTDAVRFGNGSTYVLEFNPDGSFHVKDVPPGKYQLRIHVTKPGTSSRVGFANPENDIGLLEREVIVPPGEGPFDLGELTVKTTDKPRSGS